MERDCIRVSHKRKRLHHLKWSVRLEGMAELGSWNSKIEVFPATEIVVGQSL